MESRTITIGAILLFLAWFIAQAFFSAPAEQNPAIGVPVAKICLVLSLTGFGLIIIRALIGFKSRQKKNSERISNMYLKTYGNKINVDLSVCLVTNTADKTTIEYKTEINGETKKFISEIATTDIKKVQQKITDTKVTTLYIDTKDNNKYYLDTEFLE